MMKAKEGNKNFLNWIKAEEENWIFELKMDGNRTFWERDRLLSARFIDCNNKFRHIYKELNGLNAILDGEIAIENKGVLDLNCKENWKDAKYYVFDILEIDCLDLRTYNLVERQKELKKAIEGLENVKFIKQFNSFDEGWNYVKQNNLEGLIAKDKRTCYLGNIYLDTRTWAWVKIKNWKEERLRIIGIEEGETKGSFILENGTKVSALKPSIAKLYNPNDILEAEITYITKTKNGKLFQPTMKRLFKNNKEVML